MEETNKIKNAFIYARTSSDKDYSIETQVENACQHCLKEKINILDIYIDRGVSGMTADRPKFWEMMSKLESETVKYVIATEPDRIARDLMTYYLFKQTLKAKNVSLIFTSTNLSQEVRLYSQLNKYRNHQIVNENPFKGLWKPKNIKL